MSANVSLGMRLREIRTELYGANGVQSLARFLEISSSTWRNYERGVVMPALILLKFVDNTGSNPHWLLTGEGERIATQTL
jgi:hypothetical protein